MIGNGPLFGDGGGVAGFGPGAAPHVEDGLYFRSDEQRIQTGEGDILVLSSTFVKITQEHIDPAIADIWLLAAYLGEHFLSTPLDVVVRQNIIKINERVATGRIDKSDGPRD